MFRVSTQFKKFCSSLSQAPKYFNPNIIDLKKNPPKPDEPWRKWMGTVPHIEQDVKWAVEYLTAKGEEINPRKIMDALQDRHDRLTKEMLAKRDFHEW